MGLGRAQPYRQYSSTAVATAEVGPSPRSTPVHVIGQPHAVISGPLVIEATDNTKRHKMHGDRTYVRQHGMDEHYVDTFCVYHKGQPTGLCACCSRYGDCSLASRLVCLCSPSAACDAAACGSILPTCLRPNAPGMLRATVAGR